MTRNADYEAIDRAMSSHVVACFQRGTRFYLTDDGTASDIFSRARLYRWADEADAAAKLANGDPAWRYGFHWQAASVAAEYAAREAQ